MSRADVRFFIDQAKPYGMPTAFLTRLLNEYDWDFESGRDDRVRDGWTVFGLLPHELILSEYTSKGLGRLDWADSVSVLTLYHEGTHAYIDLVDYDDSREFEEAKEYYNWAPLEDGNKVLPIHDTERAVQEAAAEYVGHRASTLWKTWGRLKFLDLMVKRVSDGQTTVAQAIQVMRGSGKHTVRNDYWKAMSQQYFGYVDHRGQVEINYPIYPKLSAFCDRTILENSILDQFDHMAGLNTYYQAVYQSAQKFPELAKVIEEG
jgi:hypothetical protein